MLSFASTHSGFSRTALIQEALATCVYLHLNSLQCNKLKCQFLSHLSHISSAPWPHVARGSRTGQCGYRMFPTSRKVLLDSSGLDTVQPWNEGQQKISATTHSLELAVLIKTASAFLLRWLIIIHLKTHHKGTWKIHCGKTLDVRKAQAPNRMLWPCFWQDHLPLPMVIQSLTLTRGLTPGFQLGALGRFIQDGVHLGLSSVPDISL